MTRVAVDPAFQAEGPEETVAAPMADILFVKTSSLGDVIHHMPALTEARRQRPNDRFGWVVEEAFAPLVRMHPAADTVIPTASRRWRRRMLQPATLREAAASLWALRKLRYDEIIDTQGLMRSAAIARMVRGRRHGYDSASIRERAATLVYNVRHSVDRDLHAVARNRLLTGLALGYTPEGPPDYGLNRAAIAGGAGEPYAIFLHATARPGKEWPQANWIELGTALRARNIPLLLPWWSQTEHERSRAIAASMPNAVVPERQPTDAMARLIAGASFVVGVDTGLLHLAAALRVPLVGIFLASEPALTGPVGQGPIRVVGGRGQFPSVADVMAAVEPIA
jgi:heptosyltransferase-1